MNCYLPVMKSNCSFKTFFTICSVFLVLNCPSQVSYFQGTLKEAMSKAANESKFVLLQFEAAECEHCNDVANKGLEHKEVADKLEQAFISLKITPDHPDRIQIANAYHFIPQKSFGTLFLDNNGTLLHSFLKTTSFYKEYLKQIDIALTRAGEVLQIGQLEKEYKNGNKSFGFLEMLLEKRKVLHLETDSLLEEYVQTLPVDSLKTVRTLVFIAKMAPMLDSKADRVLRGDHPAFRLAWYRMPTTVRSSINGQVIFKGMQKAIKERNEKLALRTAYFASVVGRI